MSVRRRAALAAAVVVSLGALGAAAAPQARLNPVVELLSAGEPVFGLYAPANRRGATDGDEAKTPAQLADEAVAYAHADFLFDGSMEGDFERGYAGYEAFASAHAAASRAERGAAPRLGQPLFVKTPAIAADPALAAERIARQLNTGAAGIVFVHVETADEVRAGLAAMRFRSRGGTRPDDDVGEAPARWGLTEDAYRAEADLWPLNPDGELVNWTIVESMQGLANIREIAAVPGIGVLFPGAGTLRRVFTTTDAEGNRVFDEASWEAAIRTVLAACREFDVPCGYPANADDIEMRMRQGFSVFIMPWGDGGFRAIDIGRRASGRTHE